MNCSNSPYSIKSIVRRARLAYRDRCRYKSKPSCPWLGARSATCTCSGSPGSESSAESRTGCSHIPWSLAQPYCSPRRSARSHTSLSACSELVSEPSSQRRRVARLGYLSIPRQGVSHLRTRRPGASRPACPPEPRQTAPRWRWPISSSASSLYPRRTGSPNHASHRLRIDMVGCGSGRGCNSARVPRARTRHWGKMDDDAV